jgi:carbonic anhydrase
MDVIMKVGRYVPAGTVLKNQGDADKIPGITDSFPLKDLNKGVVNVNTSLSEQYKKARIYSGSLYPHPS